MMLRLHFPYSSMHDDWLRSVGPLLGCPIYLYVLHVNMAISPLISHLHTHDLQKSNYCFLPNLSLGLPSWSINTQIPWTIHSVWLSLPSHSGDFTVVLKNEKVAVLTYSFHSVPWYIVVVMFIYMFLVEISESALKRIIILWVSGLAAHKVGDHSGAASCWPRACIHFDLVFVMAINSQRYTKDRVAFLERSSLSPQKKWLCVCVCVKQWKNKAFPVRSHQGKHYCPKTARAKLNHFL